MDGKRRPFAPAAACALLAALASASPACKRHKPAVTVEEPAIGTVASTVRMGDPRTAGQLVSGFHNIEAHAWRWSMRQFSVILRPPPGSPERGAVLTLSLTVPPVVIETQKTISLTASINGNKFPAESWSIPGNYVYQRDVPANLLTRGIVRVDFELDKVMPGNERDARELGVVVSRAALESK